jgi:hypothetical protein
MSCPNVVSMGRQSVEIMSGIVGQLFSEVGGQTAEEKGEKNGARCFARGKVGQQRVHKVSGTGIAEGRVIQKGVSQFNGSFAIRCQELEACVSVGGGVIGGGDEVTDSLQGDGGQVGYSDIITVQLGRDSFAAKYGFCLLKPESGLLHVKSGQLNVINSSMGRSSGGGRGLDGIEMWRLEGVAALWVQNVARRRRLELLHGGGKLGVVSGVEKRRRLHNVSLENAESPIIEVNYTMAAMELTLLAKRYSIVYVNNATHKRIKHTY